MRLIIFLLFSLFLCSINSVKSQTKALTENGKEVILYDDGTWKYSPDSSNANQDTPDTITVNPLKFYKSSAAKFLVKSNIINMGVYIDPSKWTFISHTGNEVNPEYRFESKSKNGYVFLISEKTSIDIDKLLNVALINAQHASADATITNSEYRTVNNKKILCIHMKATVEGIKFIYEYYDYSNENGTVQLVGYTTEKLYDSEKKELEECLNGLVEIEK